MDSSLRVSELLPGDVIAMRHIVGGGFRTVHRLAADLLVPGALDIFYREGRTREWGHANCYRPDDVVNVVRRGEVPEGVATCDLCGCDTNHTHRSDDYWAPVGEVEE